MAEETENLILRLLRDIRAKQDDHDQRFGAAEREIGDLKRRIEQLERAH